MDAHFLAGVVAGVARPPQDTPRSPWYNAHGDCITFQCADEAVVADRIDDILTIYRSALDSRPIGFQLKDVKALMRKSDWAGVVVNCKQDGHEVQEVSLSALLLTAYEALRPSISRRRAYAMAVDLPGRRPGLRLPELTSL